MLGKRVLYKTFFEWLLNDSLSKNYFHGTQVLSQYEDRILRWWLFGCCPWAVSVMAALLAGD